MFTFTDESKCARPLTPPPPPQQARNLARVSEQLEIATNSLTELEDDIETSTSKADKAHKEVLHLMEQVDGWGQF